MKEISPNTNPRQYSPVSPQVKDNTTPDKFWICSSKVSQNKLNVSPGLASSIISSFAISTSTTINIYRHQHLPPSKSTARRLKGRVVWSPNPNIQDQLWHVRTQAMRYLRYVDTSNSSFKIPRGRRFSQGRIV